MNDDLGHPIQLARPVRRIVSLVPSLTDSIASVRPECLVGATDWCTHPDDLDVTRIRGTKNPDLDAICALAPDLVLANQEENRQLDVSRLRERGIEVWVTVIESVDDALQSLRRLFTEALDWPVPDWLVQADEVWSRPVRPSVSSRGLRCVIPIWRDPWMVVGGRTFTSDLVARLGVPNLYADDDGRYPHVEVAELVQRTAATGSVVLLPDEPYVFTAEDGPEAFVGQRTVLVSGRGLTWYGPPMVTARDDLEAAIFG